MHSILLNSVYTEGASQLTLLQSFQLCFLPNQHNVQFFKIELHFWPSNVFIFRGYEEVGECTKLSPGCKMSHFLSCEVLNHKKYSTTQRDLKSPICKLHLNNQNYEHSEIYHYLMLHTLVTLPCQFYYIYLGYSIIPIVELYPLLHILKRSNNVTAEHYPYSP